MLTPLKFNTQYFEKIWGGQKLRTLMGKDFGTMANCGESWEVSGIAGKENVILRYVLLGFRTGPAIGSLHARPEVHELEDIVRKVGNER